MKWDQLENDPKTWKWIWLISTLTYISTVLSSLSDGDINIGFVLLGLIIISLYGLAYERPILARKFWRFLFWFMAIFLGLVLLLFLIAFIGNPFGISSPAPSQQVPIYVKIIELMLMALIGLEIRGLYLYAYRREKIWII